MNLLGCEDPVFKRPLFLAALGVFCPNVVFWVFAEWLGIGRSYLNVDYALAILAMAFGLRWFGLLLGLVFLLLDVLALAGQVLPFVRVTDVFYLLQFVASASTFHFFLLIAVCFLVLLKLGVLLALGRCLPQRVALLLFFILLAIYAVHINLSSDTGRKFYRLADGALAGSQALSFFQSRSSGFLKRADYEGRALAPLVGASATAAWFELEEPSSDRFLLIVAESWGVPRDERIQVALLRPLQEALSRPLQRGGLEFSGMTVGGELRELCRLQPNHFNLVEVVEGFDNCLPKALKARGFATASMHGAVSLMYDRRYWYPRVGFDQTIFFESKLWPRRCHSFPGACDLDLRQEVSAFFSEPGRRFFYWLTLNSHSPYELRDISRDVFNCLSFDVPVDSESCRNLKLQAQFFSGLAELVQAESMRGVEVIVVGDHEPVLMNLNEKKALFAERKVPWVHFKID